MCIVDADDAETLQDLFRRRARELNPGGEPLSVRAVLLRAREGSASYETFRRIENGSHANPSNISDDIIEALAVALDVPPSTVIAAAGQRPRLGRFELPRRFDRLTPSERDLIISMGDAILSAADADRPFRGAELRLAAPPSGRRRVLRAARRRDEEDGQG